MKIAIINDTHFGHKNDSPFFLEESLRYFENNFFPYLKEHNIKHVLHLGDLMDRRKYVNFYTLSQVQKRFIELFNTHKITLHITLGNHDTYFKNTNQINSVKELFSRHEYINLYEEPVELYFSGLKIALIPWMTKDNADICLDYISNTSASILAGHFEINGFEVVSNIRHSSGNDIEMFGKFDKVLSGHFHIRQSKENVHYLGTQYQLSFADVNVSKGFTVLDTQTRELEFIENPRKIFHLLKYDDVNDITSFDCESVKGSMVKLIVLNKNKHRIFEKFMESLMNCELQELSVVEEIERDLSDDDAVDMSQDTLSIIAKEIDSNENIIHKDRIKNVIKELYMESMTL
jgi:DNA repair exonuclease SbcCD nuclease subunit